MVRHIQANSLFIYVIYPVKRWHTIPLYMGYVHITIVQQDTTGLPWHGNDIGYRLPYAVCGIHILYCVQLWAQIQRFTIQIWIVGNVGLTNNSHNPQFVDSRKERLHPTMSCNFRLFDGHTPLVAFFDWIKSFLVVMGGNSFKGILKSTVHRFSDSSMAR